MSVIHQPMPEAAAPEQAIDRRHLARMTLGEQSLERELLSLFLRQTELLLPRLRHAGRPAAATLAHTLRGSALGIGAFSVARAAEVVEQAPESTLSAAIDGLAAAIAGTHAEITRLLRPH